MPSGVRRYVPEEEKVRGLLAKLMCARLGRVPTEEELDTVMLGLSSRVRVMAQSVSSDAPSAGRASPSGSIRSEP